MISKTLTGHMYRGSIHETASDCGNCNGGRCEGCIDSWEVEGVDEIFYDRYAAIEAESDLTLQMLNLLQLSVSLEDTVEYTEILDSIDPYSINFSVVDDMLYAKVDVCIERVRRDGKWMPWRRYDAECICDIHHKLYQKYYDKTLKESQPWL